MTPHSPEACARAGIPYTPEWRERVGSPIYGSISPMEYAVMDTDSSTVEPAHAVLERALDRGSRLKGLVRVGEHEYSKAWWKHEWRTMPDYDGGGNAPSGVIFEELRSGRLQVDTHLVNKRRVKRGFVGRNKAEGMVDPRSYFPGWHLVEREFAVWCAPSARYGLEQKAARGGGLFAPPSEGGRGWCPKLATVNDL